MFSTPVLGCIALRRLTRVLLKFMMLFNNASLFRRVPLIFTMISIIMLSSIMPNVFAQTSVNGKSFLHTTGQAEKISHAASGSILSSLVDLERINDRDRNRNENNDGSNDDNNSRHHNGEDGNRENSEERNSSHNFGNNNNLGGIRLSDGDNGENHRENNNGADERCNCIVMRLDDVQDEWIRDVQLALLDRLISDHVHTSTGIIMHDFGSDDAIVSKIGEGGNAGLFEYVIHGWDHVDYGTLSLEEQKRTLLQANAKLVDVLGKDSDIFATPYNDFSEDTLNAMDQIGMKIISSDDTDLFPAAPKESPLYPQVVHMPQTINFADQVGEVKVLRPLDQIVSAVRTDIVNKGYAVLTLHPQDFTQYNGTVIQNKVNPGAMNLLEQFIMTVRDEGFSFAGFEQALEDNHPDLSTIPDKSKPYESILTPRPDSSFKVNSQVIVTGRAIDDTGVDSVEVRTTNSSYAVASTNNDFEDWTKIVQMPSTPGRMDIFAKATDVGGKQTWIQIPVNVMR